MERKGLLLILLSVACYGSASIFAKIAYAGGINLLTLLTLRFSIAALLMLLFALATKTNLRLDRQDLRNVCLLGGIGYVSMAFLYFGSLQYISVSLTTLLTYTYPAIVTALSCIFLRERMDRLRLAALGLVSLGCVLMVWVPGLTVNLTGASMALASAVVYSVYIIAASLCTAQINPKALTFYITLSCAVVYGTVGALTGNIDLLLPPSALAACVGLAAIPTVLGNVFFFSGLRLLGASRTALISTAEPLYTVLLAILLFHERITLTQVGGGLLIVTAVALLNQRAPEKTAAPGSTPVQG